MTARPILVRRTVTALATLIAGGVGATSTATTSASAAVPAAPTPAQERAAEPRTRLTFTVEDCEGCEVHLVNARSTLDADVVHVWQSGTRTVQDGKVTFRIATKRTWGMSVTVKAPWEGNTGYATTVAWAYDGESVGDTVTLEEAVSKRRAAACWEGTRQRRISIPLVVEEVEVDGVRGRVPGSIAFLPTTSSWIGEMRRAPGGVLGSQDVDVCR